MQPFFVPGFQNGVEIRPFETAGVQAGFFIGHADDLVGEAPIHPLVHIVLFPLGQPPLSQLQGGGNVPMAALPRQLRPHKGHGGFHMVDALVGPAVGLPLDVAEAGGADAPLPIALDAVTDQNGNNIRRHAQVLVDAEEAFQLLRGKDAA